MADDLKMTLKKTGAVTESIANMVRPNASLSLSWVAWSLFWEIVWIPSSCWDVVSVDIGGMLLYSIIDQLLAKKKEA